ncbi:nucleotidyltransferase family protein [Bacillus sp. 3255]|uniref:nucleotidyltransferase family protein n=1 Tax=Bacillus sp. 3255 TaxID=2817904 RepID=UPI00285CBB0A|nr:nucleotidyltransferase family protein [Bacillus sp. 3255]MDR6878669.1 hypothetical protein [Bacillus sp. 3255]
MIITLIQALYDPRIPMPQDQQFYEQAWEDAEFFEISPQIYGLLKQREQLERTPLFFQERLRHKFNKAVYQNMFIRHQTQLLLAKLEEACIETIPLKGTLFAEKYFGHLGARCTSDIDLLIRPSELEKAILCVKSLGYTIEQERISGHFHWSFSKPIPDSVIPLTVELHWDLLKENTSNLRIEEFWEQAAPLGAYRYMKELSDYHTFYMICLHGWRHNLNSLKYFLDIIQIIHHLNGKLSFDRLQRDAAAHRTQRRIGRTLAIVYAYFPHLTNTLELPEAWKVRLWWEYSSLRYKKRSLQGYLNWVYYHIFDYDKVQHTCGALLEWPYRAADRVAADRNKKL